MYTEIEAARYLIMKSACDKDEGKNYDRSSAMAKLYASKVARNKLLKRFKYMVVMAL